MNIEKEIKEITDSINDTDVSDMKGILNIPEKVDRLLELKNTQATNEVREILEGIPVIELEGENNTPLFTSGYNTAMQEIMDWKQIQLKLLDETT